MAQINQYKREPLFTYRPATFIQGKRWYIEYYIWNPLTDNHKLVRKKIMLTRHLKRIKSLKEKKYAAALIVSELNIKLRSGWNPFIEEKSNKAYKTVEEALYTYLNKTSYDKREATISGYKALTRNFLSWIKMNYGSEMKVIQVNSVIAVEYIDHIYIGRNNSRRTRKNNLDFLITAFDWLIKHGFLLNNPFKSVDRIKGKKDRKFRKPIANEIQEKIVEYFNNTYPGYNFVIQYLYLCMIRRTEMTSIKVKDVSLKNQTIKVRANIAKNKHERFATIPDELMIKMIELNLSSLPQNWFLVSDNEFLPGPKKVNPRRITSVWNHMKIKLNLPKELQFYSLRDTGVINYLKSGVDSKSMVDQADWQSYDMINVYANHIEDKSNPVIRDKGKLFG